MATIGKVTVGNTNRQTVSIRQSQQTSIANPNIELQKPSLGLADLIDVSLANEQNGYVLVYNAVTNKYESDTIKASDFSIDEIAGGTF